MKIKVGRTSDCFNKKQPIEGAYMETFISPYNGATIKEWYVDLDECDVFNLVDKYGDIILSKRKNGYEIEIYDDYRE